MIDAHLLLNLGPSQGDGLSLSSQGEQGDAPGKAQQFAEALRQVHAAGRQRLPLPHRFGSLEARCEWSLRRDLRRVIHPLKRFILGLSRP